MTPADLVVREDGVAREILSVEPATDPMRIALLVDNSQAATRAIQFLRDALTAFATRMTGGGPLGLAVTLGDRPTLQVDATTDLARLKSRGIDRLFAQPGSGMYLLEALIETAKGFSKNETPRPVIVAVVTEGMEFSNASGRDRRDRAIRDSGARSTRVVLTEGEPAEPGRGRSAAAQRRARPRHRARTAASARRVISNMALKDRLDSARQRAPRPGRRHLRQPRAAGAGREDHHHASAAREGLTARGVPVKVAAAPVPER